MLVISVMTLCEQKHKSSPDSSSELDFTGTGAGESEETAAVPSKKPDDTPPVTPNKASRNRDRDRRRRSRSNSLALSSDHDSGTVTPVGEEVDESKAVTPTKKPSKARAKIKPVETVKNTELRSIGNLRPLGKPAEASASYKDIVPEEVEEESDLEDNERKYGKGIFEVTKSRLSDALKKHLARLAPLCYEDLGPWYCPEYTYVRKNWIKVDKRKKTVTEVVSRSNVKHEE